MESFPVLCSYLSLGSFKHDISMTGGVKFKVLMQWIDYRRADCLTIVSTQEAKVALGYRLVSICRANAHMVYGLKHQHFTSHSITLFVLNISATRPYVTNAT